MTDVRLARQPAFLEVGTNLAPSFLTILRIQHLQPKRILFLADPTTFAIGGDALIRALRRTGIHVCRVKVENSKEKTVNRIMSRIRLCRAGLVIGYGGGKVLDVAKLAAGRARTKFLSFPTILSNDGIASPVAIIKDDEGIPVSHLTRPPWGVIVDIGVVRRAPIRHLRAGIGDLVSNLSSVYDARLAKRRGAGHVDDYALSLAEAGPALLIDLGKGGIKHPEFLMKLTEGLAQSGLAMGIAGSSQPASGSEHKISHSLDRFLPRARNLHGEQVGIACLFTMALQGNRYLDRVRRFYRRIGFPQRLSYLGLSPDMFVRVVQDAPRMRPERYTILEERVLTDKDILKTVKALKL